MIKKLYLCIKGNVHISIQRVGGDFSPIFCMQAWIGIWFLNQKPKWGKTIPPSFFAHFSDIFSKTLCCVYLGCLKSLTLGRETQFWTLGFISPLFLYNSPLLRIFPIVKRPMTSSDFISRDLSLIFLHAGLNWHLVFESKTKQGGKMFPLIEYF